MNRLQDPGDSWLRRELRARVSEPDAPDEYFAAIRRRIDAATETDSVSIPHKASTIEIEPSLDIAERPNYRVLIAACIVGCLVVFGAFLGLGREDSSPVEVASEGAPPTETAVETTATTGAEGDDASEDSIAQSIDADVSIEDQQQFFEWLSENDTDSLDYGHFVQNAFMPPFNDAPPFVIVAGEHESGFGVSLIGQPLDSGFEFAIAVADSCAAPLDSATLRFDAFDNVQLNRSAVLDDGPPLDLGGIHPDCPRNDSELTSFETALAGRFAVSIESRSFRISTSDTEHLFQLRPKDSIIEVDDAVTKLNSYISGVSNIFEETTSTPKVLSVDLSDLEGTSLTLRQGLLVSSETNETDLTTLRNVAIFTDKCGGTLRRGRFVNASDGSGRLRFKDGAPGVGFVKPTPACDAGYPVNLDRFLDELINVEIGFTTDPRGTLILSNDFGSIEFTNPRLPVEQFSGLDSQRSLDLAEWVSETGFSDSEVDYLILTIPGTNNAPAATLVRHKIGEQRVDFVVHQRDCSEECDPLSRRPSQTGGMLIIDDQGATSLINGYPQIEIAPIGTSNGTKPTPLPKTEILALLDKPFALDLDIETNTLRLFSEQGIIELVPRQQ